MELVGKILGNRYEIIENVGNGGMATVYKAKDKTLGRNVAIKVLKDEFANDQEFIKRFQIEAQSAAALSHPNIVSIYDVANDGDIHYIVMELIEGQTLKDVIKKEGKLGWKRSAEIASQIASGLSTAHKNHIIHRDIKPHNIIITKEGIAKITDFGIAKAATSSTINANSNSLGSVHYFSPEHARGGYTDEKSDIYSLGVVLYEMVTGKLPFDGDSAVGIAMKHLKEDPVPPIEIAHAIPIGLNNIILKAMQKVVSDRYVSASSMYSDLQKVLKDPTAKDVGIMGSEDKKFATQRVPQITNASAIKSANAKMEGVTKVMNGEKMNTNKKKSKKSHSNPIAVALVRLLLIILLVGGFAAIGYIGINKMMSDPREMAEVPYVIGRTSELAQQMLEEAGFKMQIDGEVENEEYPRNFIAKQTYPSGEKVTKGTTIRVSLSKGPKTVLVPNLSDGTKTDRVAMIELDQLGLKYEIEEEENEEIPAGNVIRQAPDQGMQVESGSVITLVVSTGPKAVIVPDLSSLNEAQAIEALQLLELIPEISYTTKENVEDGKILSQSISPEEKVAPGETVYIVINKLQKEEEQPITPGEDTPVKPENPNNNINKEEYKYLKVDVSTKGSRNTFTVKVTLNGDIKGRTNIYEETHSRADGVLNVPYPADATGMIRVYIDGVLDSEMLIPN